MFCQIGVSNEELEDRDTDSLLLLEEGAPLLEEADSSYRIEANSFRRKQQQAPEKRSYQQNSSLDLSPPASDSRGSSRLLPSVPKRFVIPRISASDYEKKVVSFQDENNAVTHLGGLNRKGAQKPCLRGSKCIFSSHMTQLLREIP